MLTTNSAVYPAIVNKRLVWIVDVHHVGQLPVLRLTSLATADPTKLAFNADKKASTIRSSVKALWIL